MTAVLRRHDSRACGTADDEMTFFVIQEMVFQPGIAVLSAKNLF